MMKNDEVLKNLISLVYMRNGQISLPQLLGGGEVLCVDLEGKASRSS